MLHWVISAIAHLGYAGVLALMFLENIILPLPAELIMPLSGFVAARGGLALAGVLLAGFAGELAGALPWYFLGRSLGEGRAREWLRAHGRWLLLRPKELERAHRWFEGRGRLTVLLARLAPGVHPLIGVPAGVARMALLPFLVFSAAGIALWVGGLGMAGYALGAHYGKVGTWLRPVTLASLLLLLGGGTWLVLRRRRGRRR